MGTLRGVFIQSDAVKRKRIRAQYAKRDKKVRALGYPTYKAYLKSSLWAGIRKRVLERDKYACVSCGKKATQVHHRSYTTAALKGTSIEALLSVCGHCHEFIEFDKDGKKLSIGESRVWLRYITKMNRYGGRNGRSSTEARGVDPASAARGQADANDVQAGGGRSRGGCQAGRGTQAGASVGD